jgi:hypothetical protein
MSKPNVLTQIYDAVLQIDAKTNALKTQLTELETKVKPLENLPTQLTGLDTKVSEIQSILTIELPPLPVSLK